MHVTPEGKAIFDEAMARTNKNVVRIIMNRSDSQGASLRMDLIDQLDAPHALDVDGVLFDLDEGAAEYLAEAIFDAEGPNLKVIARPHGCGCHHHDHGCDCCGDDCDCHHEDGGCCHDGDWKEGHHCHHKA